MLSITEYNYIKLLYEKFLKTNEYINDLMKKNEWDGVGYAVEDKDALIKQIMQFERVHLDKIKANPELLKTRLTLIELEKRNIELLKVLKEKLSKEINTVSKTKKVLNTYEPDSVNSLSTIDVSDEDD